MAARTNLDGNGERKLYGDVGMNSRSGTGEDPMFVEEGDRSSSRTGQGDDTYTHDILVACNETMSGELRLSGRERVGRTIIASRP